MSRCDCADCVYRSRRMTSLQFEELRSRRTARDLRNETAAASAMHDAWIEEQEPAKVTISHSGAASYTASACKGGPCNQGRKPCPTQQACQVVMWDVEREAARSIAAMFGKFIKSLARRFA